MGVKEKRSRGELKTLEQRVSPRKEGALSPKLKVGGWAVRDGAKKNITKGKAHETFGRKILREAIGPGESAGKKTRDTGMEIFSKIYPIGRGGSQGKVLRTAQRLRVFRIGKTKTHM